MSEGKTAERVYRGLVVDVYHEQVDLPNGATCEMEIIDHPGGAVVAAIDERYRICLLRQYRHVAGGWLWELPAGKIDNREEPLCTAKRELLEEAGCEASLWTSLGTMHSSPGIYNEVVHLYAARGLRVGVAKNEEHEVIQIHWMPFQSALEWARDGTITDAKSVIGLFRASTLVA